MRPAALRVVLVAASIALLPIGALAQVLYKWIDKDGRVQYSDQPPKGFSGPVTRIEPDEAPTPSPAPPIKDPGVPKAAKAGGAMQDIIDMAAKKREERGKLEARVKAAREKLAAAQAARDGATPGDNERQVVQQRQDQAVPLPGPGSSTTGGMFGMGAMNGTAARSNCTTSTNAAGNNVVMCPTAVPSEAYYDRIKQLDDAVKAAQDELDDAERAYRRGVD